MKQLNIVIDVFNTIQFNEHIVLSNKEQSIYGQCVRNIWDPIGTVLDPIIYNVTWGI